MNDPRGAHALTAREAVHHQPERFVVPPLFPSGFVYVVARKSGKNEHFVKEALALLLALGL